MTVTDDGASRVKGDGEMTLKELESSGLTAITPSDALGVLRNAWGDAAPTRGTFYRNLKDGTLWFQGLRVGSRWMVPVKSFLAGVKGQ